MVAAAELCGGFMSLKANEVLADGLDYHDLKRKCDQTNQEEWLAMQLGFLKSPTVPV